MLQNIKRKEIKDLKRRNKRKNLIDLLREGLVILIFII